MYKKFLFFQFYPTDLVNSKTTIPLRVGEQHYIYTSTLCILVYLPLFTSLSGDSCILFTSYFGDSCTVEPQFNKPLYGKVLGITNNNSSLSKSKTYGKEP